MRRSLKSAVAALVLALSVAGSGAGAVEGACRELRPATETSPAVMACEQSVWFHQAQTKAGNLAAAPAEAGQSFPSWNTTKPTASATTGAGAGYATVAAVDAFAENDPAARPRFVGTFQGALDNLALSAYVYAPAPQNAGSYDVILRVDVDGQTVWNNYDTAVTVPLQSGASPYEPARFDLTLTDIAPAMEAQGLPLEGTHNLEVSIINYYFGEDHSVVVYDAAEVPSGIVFNLDPTSPAYLSSTKVSAWE